MIAALSGATRTDYLFSLIGKVVSVPRDRPTFEQIIRGDIPVSDLDFNDSDIDAVFGNHWTFFIKLGPINYF